MDLKQLTTPSLEPKSTAILAHPLYLKYLFKKTLLTTILIDRIQFRNHV